MAFSHFVLISFRSYNGIPIDVVPIILPIGFVESAKLCFPFCSAKQCFPR